MECIYCKSSNIVENVEISSGDIVRPIGLMYKEGKIWIKTEPIIGDLCKDCGSVRLYVKNSNRNWIKQK